MVCNVFHNSQRNTFTDMKLNIEERGKPLKRGKPFKENRNIFIDIIILIQTFSFYSLLL